MLSKTDSVQSYEDLCRTICWDDDEDVEAALAPGVYATAAGEWRREENDMWRFWQDDLIMAELLGWCDHKM
jgi:hypothetical protein